MAHVIVNDVSGPGLDCLPACGLLSLQPSQASTAMSEPSNRRSPALNIPAQSLAVPVRPHIGRQQLAETPISRVGTPDLWPRCLMHDSVNASLVMSPPLLSEADDGGGVDGQEDEMLLPLAVPAVDAATDSADQNTEHTTTMSRNGHRRSSSGNSLSRMDTIKQRVRYYVPVLGWAPIYNFRTQFPRDAIAGISVACLIIPQSLSFASALAGIPAVNGLYTAFIAGVVYTFMGTSRQLSVGPEAMISMLVGHSIGVFQATSTDSAAETVSPVVIAALLCFFVGLFDLCLGLLRLGFLDSLLSRALLRGFITAIAVVIMTGQCIAMLGLGALAKLPESAGGLTEDASTWEKVWFMYEHATDVHAPTAWLSLACVMMLFFIAWAKVKVARTCPRHLAWVEHIPEILLVVVLACTGSYVYKWNHRYGIPVLGPMPEAQWPDVALPSFFTPSKRQLHDLLVTAALIAVIGFVESVVVAKQYATKHGYYCSANRELCALGAANIASSLVGGLPAFASLARSRINDRAGAQTQLAGACCAATVGLTLAFLLPVFEYLPTPTLAALIFVAAFGLLHETPHEVYFLWHCAAWTDLVMLWGTFFVTCTLGVETGTVVAVGASLLWVVRHTTVPRLTVLGRVRGTRARFHPIQDLHASEVAIMPRVLVLRVEQGLYFANSGQFGERLRRIERFGDAHAHPARMLPPSGRRLKKNSRQPSYFEAKRLRDLVFDFGPVTVVDATAVQVLLELVRGYSARGVRVHFVRVRRSGPIWQLMERAGVVKEVGVEHMWNRIGEVIEWIEDEDEDQEIHVAEGIAAGAGIVGVTSGGGSENGKGASSHMALFVHADSDSPVE